MNPAILRAKEISLRYENKIILNQVDVSLPEHSIIGLVGINGSGKSSLMKILAGIIDFDEGEITKAKTVTMEYVTQEFDGVESINCGEFLKIPGLIDDDSRLYLDRLTELRPFFNFPELDVLIQNLSGGQKRQLSLYRALAIQPQILLLDEPTNHLDLKTMISIQALFKNYPGTILMISHDRYFLDSCVDTIWELDDGQLYMHPGNYSDFILRKQKRRADQTQMYFKLKQELKREHEWFISGVKARGTKDNGRTKRYFELKSDVKNLKPRWKELKLPIPKPQPLGKKIIDIKEVNIPYPHNKELLIENLDFSYQEGMRVGLLGPNGSGKTTLIRTLLGLHKKSKGKISIGQNTIFNYHDQNRKELDQTKTIHETINEGNIDLIFGERKINIFAYMKKFLFGSEDLKTYVSTLSGGERARLLLAKILKSGGNFLILDEPTNDLDLDTIQALENTLTSFAGCALIVSHDRFFLDTVCTHIIALEGEGTYTISTGGYSRYISHYKQEEDFWTGKTTKNPEPADQNSVQHSLKAVSQQAPLDINAITKPKLSTKQARQTKAQLRTLETLIATIEERIRTMTLKISQPDFYTQSHDKIVREHQNLTLLQEELHKHEVRWLELSEQL